MATVAPEPTVQALDQAFERLYQRYVAEVYRYALALLRNPADAEDVTQTTFMNAYRAFKRGDEIQKPHNWLIKITHNVARSRYAQAGRRVQEVPLEDHIEQLTVPGDDKPDLDTVLHALGRLPFNQRGALVMRELEGRTYAEIADTLGVSVSAVETLIFRARKSLRVKAASLRVLTGAPLPGSLASLVQGGGAIAGSNAIIGAGFVAKALVAVAVGVVATGVGGDRSGRAGAAERSGGVVAPSASGVGADTRRPVAARGKRARPGATRLLVRRPVLSHRGSGPRAAGEVPTNALASGGPQGGLTASAGVVSSPAAGAASTSRAGSREAPAPSAGTPFQAATTVAQNAVDSVTGAVPPIAVPSVPVNVPSPPPLAVPGLPPVHVPAVPPATAPSVPAVQAPPLPPAPPLPRLP